MIWERKGALLGKAPLRVATSERLSPDSVISQVIIIPIPIYIVVVVVVVK